MGTVIARCPNTGEEVATGVMMDQTEFETAYDSGRSFECPACGKTHTWNKKTARVSEDPPVS